MCSRIYFLYNFYRAHYQYFLYFIYLTVEPINNVSSNSSLQNMLFLFFLYAPGSWTWFMFRFLFCFLTLTISLHVINSKHKKCLRLKCAYSTVFTWSTSFFPRFQEDFNQWNYWKLPLPLIDVWRLSSLKLRRAGRLDLSYLEVLR